MVCSIFNNKNDVDLFVFDLMWRHQRHQRCLHGRRHKRANVTCTQRPRDPAYKDGFAGIQRLRPVHDKVAVTQVPGTDLDLCKVETDNCNVPSLVFVSI